MAESEEEISPPYPSPSLSQSAVDTSLALVTPQLLAPPPPQRRLLEQPLSAFQRSIMSSIQKEKENVVALDEQRAESLLFFWEGGG